jgi:hypothetical protein
MESDDVIRAVTAAFERADLPSAADLTNDHCDECIETYREFWSEPRTFMIWQEAARRQGSYFEAALLSVEAWRYYLPTLIVWCVRDTDNVDALVENLVHELTPPPPSDSEWFGPRSVGFSADQRKAIAHFLDWYRDKEKAEWASIGREPPDDAAGATRYWSGAG